MTDAEHQLRTENERLRAKLCALSARLADMEEQFAWEFSQAPAKEEMAG